MPEQTDDGIRVFVCYSHADRRWLDRLLVHLAPLQRRHAVDVWSDRQIQSGTRWREEIRVAIERCNTAVLVISPDFLASEFIANDELPPLLQAADQRGALIIPVIVGPCLFLHYPELAVFQAANDPAVPLLMMDPGPSEAVFVDVAERILDRAQQAEAGREGADVTLPRCEDFRNPDTWARLVKIGDWVRDTSADRIVGSEMHTFLLSREQYGSEPFSIEAKLSFSPHQPARSQRLGFNAGIIVGWTHEKKNPRYYNILITGTEILLERVGFDAPHGRSAEHITTSEPLVIVPGEAYRFRVRVNGRDLRVEVDGDERIRTDDGPILPGRVGVRPWRSTVSIHEFAVGTEQR